MGTLEKRHPSCCVHSHRQLVLAVAQMVSENFPGVAGPRERAGGDRRCCRVGGCVRGPETVPGLLEGHPKIQTSPPPKKPERDQCCSQAYDGCFRPLSSIGTRDIIHGHLQASIGLIGIRTTTNINRHPGESTSSAIDIHIHYTQARPREVVPGGSGLGRVSGSGLEQHLQVWIPSDVTRAGFGVAVEDWGGLRLSDSVPGCQGSHASGSACSYHD